MAKTTVRSVQVDENQLILRDRSESGCSDLDIVRFNGTNYVPAQADSVANADVSGIIINVSGGTGDVITAGYLDGLSGLTAGDVYYLDPSSAGGMTNIKPAPSGIHVPIGIAIDTGIFHVFHMGLINRVEEAGQAYVDTHTSDATIHFTEAAIDHTNILNIGSNTHVQIDTHLADATTHFTEAAIDHTNILNIGSNSHVQIDGHISSTANPHGTTFANLGSKPTTIAGFGITDAYTKTESDTRYVNVTGDTITGTLGFTLGTTINEFSVDGTLAGNSDDATPTEKAVKTYVDNAVSGITTYWQRNVTTLSPQTSGDSIYVDSTVASTSITTGAAVIDGGVGIGENLYVNDYANIDTNIRIKSEPLVAGSSVSIGGSNNGAGGFYNSVMLGHDIGTNVAEDINNAVLIGKGAGEDNTCDTMVGIGYNCVGSGTGGWIGESVAMGCYAGRSANDAYYSTVIGHSCATLSTNLNYLTAYGAYTCRSTTGSHNVGIGYSAFTDLTTGTYNTGLGCNAGDNIIGSSYSIFIGPNAGSSYGGGGGTVLTSATRCIYIGEDARAGANTVTNEIVIGDQALGNGSNSATYGNASITSHNFPAGVVNIDDTTESTSPTTGAAVIAGGVGVAKNLNVAGSATAEDLMLISSNGDDYLKIGKSSVNPVTTALFMPGDTTYILGCDALSSGSDGGDIIFRAGYGSGIGGSPGSIKIYKPNSTNLIAEFANDTSNSGLTLASGTNVNEFSIDGTLAGNSDDAVPTEKAVKTYVDTEISGITTYWQRNTTTLSPQTSGDSIYIDSTTDSTSVTTGAAVIDGGLGVAKNVSALTYNSLYAKLWDTGDGIAISIGDSTTDAAGSNGQSVRIGSSLTATGAYRGQIIGHNIDFDTDQGIIIGYDIGNGGSATDSEVISSKGGCAALAGFTGPYRSTLIGFSVNASATVGCNYSQIIGGYAGSVCRGSYVSAIGYSIFSALTTGDYNVGMGRDAGNNIVSSSNGTFLGAYAGRYYGSGTDALTSTANCTYVGYDSRGSAATVTYETVLGSEAIGNGSNTVTLGKVLTNTGVYSHGASYVAHVDATTNSAMLMQSYTRTSSGTPAAGIGAKTQYTVHTATDTGVPNNEIGGEIHCIATDVTDTAEEFAFTWNVMTGGDPAAEKMRLSGSGLKLAAGATINEFSTDGTFAGNSDTVAPTEKAVKTYVDAAVLAEDFWQRTVTTLSPQTSGDSIYIDSTTDSTALGLGSIVTDGGISVAKKVYVGDDLIAVDMAYLSRDTGYVDIGSNHGEGGPNVYIDVWGYNAGGSPRNMRQGFSDTTEGEYFFTQGAGGYFDFRSPVVVSATTTSTSSTTGALVVSGGAGIAKELYVDGSINTKNGTAGSPAIKLGGQTSGLYLGGAGTVSIATNGSYNAEFNSSGLTLLTGTAVNEFSIDGTLAGNSDDAVPTEKAVKTYVDASGGGGGNEISVNQASHGFVVGNAIYNNAGTWTKAQSDDADTLGIAIVTENTDTDNFVYVANGVTEVTSHGFTVGNYLYVSAVTVGLLIETAPTGITEYSNPLAYVVDSDNLLVLPMRPEQALERSNDMNVTHIDESYSIADSDELVLADFNAASGIVTLPTPSATYDGFTVKIKKTDSTSNEVLMKCATGNIDGTAGSTGVGITVPYHSRTLTCDGTDYWIN